MKQCSSCKELKPLDEFYFRGESKHRRRSQCIACLSGLTKERRRTRQQREAKDPGAASRTRRSRLKSVYGITEAEYDALTLSQENLCKICGQPEIIVRRGKLERLSVDHAHNVASTWVRGLLCQSCNLGLGFFRDNVEVMRRAITYLEQDFEKQAELVAEGYLAEGDKVYVYVGTRGEVHVAAREDREPTFKYNL